MPNRAWLDLAAGMKLFSVQLLRQSDDAHGLLKLLQEELQRAAEVLPRVLDGLMR